MEQKSQSKFLPWAGYAPRTSYLAVQHTTTRPPHTPSIENISDYFYLEVVLRKFQIIIRYQFKTFKYFQLTYYPPEHMPMPQWTYLLNEYVPAYGYDLQYI